MRRGLRRVIGARQKVPERYDDRTPLFEIEKMKAPVLIIHGTSDQHVDIEHAYQLEYCLQDAGSSMKHGIPTG